MAQQDIIRARNFHARHAFSFVIPKARSAEEPAGIQLVGSGEGCLARASILSWSTQSMNRQHDHPTASL